MRYASAGPTVATYSSRPRTTATATPIGPGLVRVAEAVAVALVGEPLVGDAHDLDQALPDPGRLVVVVLVADRVRDDAGRLARPAAARPRGHQEVQVALGAPHGADRRLDHDDGVGGVRQPVLLRDGAELQLETDGQGSSLMGCATRSCEGS